MARSVKDARAAREAKLDELHDRLTGAVEQLASGEDWARALVFAARFRARSFANTILIFTQHHEAHERSVECGAPKSTNAATTPTGASATKPSSPRSTSTKTTNSASRTTAPSKCSSTQINANALTWAQDSNKARTETIDDGKGSSLVRGVELRGLEPLTPCLQSRCATNCAIAPGRSMVRHR